MEIRPIKQAFGSPGGKTYLAPKIVKLIPPHKVYVEPFAGGAAVFFKKAPSEKEVLNGWDSDIAFAFRFLRDMTPEQFAELKRKDWMASERLFRKLQKMKPKNDVDRFYRFYYLRWCSYGSGGKTFSKLREGQTKDISHLPRIQERLRKTHVYNADALKLINKYDSPSTFFYLDPPYPGRAFIGQKFDDYTLEDLMRLVSRLKTIKGKFALSLSTEHLKYLPKRWHFGRLKVRRRMPVEGEWNKSFQYEILVTNYNPKSKAVRRYQIKRSNIRKRYSPPTPMLAGMRG